jgi:hypothetical protein
MLYGFDAMLVSHRGNTKLQPIELAETGRDYREFHRLFLTCQTIADILQKRIHRANLENAEFLSSGRG